MVMPSTAISRYELSMPMSEFDLMMNQKGYIAPSVFTPRLVGIQSANPGRIKLNQLLQQHDTKRASSAGYKRTDFEFESYSYSTEEYGMESPIDDRQLAIFLDMFDAESVHSDRAAGFVCDEYEREVADMVYDETTWDSAALRTTLGTKWDDHANATPIDDIIVAKEKVVAGSGLQPNALILNRLQFDHLKNCDQIVDRVKYTSEANQEKMSQAIAAVLGVNRLLVAGGLTNTANPQQVAAISRIWSNQYAMLARVAVTQDPSEPCIGRTFIWTGDGPGAVGTDEKLALTIEEYREEKVRGSVMRARNDRDTKIMYKEAAHLLKGVLTA